jgi:hypothetical protein
MPEGVISKEEMPSPSPTKAFATCKIEAPAEAGMLA